MRKLEKSESGVGRMQKGKGSHAKTIIFQKIQAGSLFLGLRWLDTALDFLIDALSRHPKLRQAGALQDTLMASKRLGQLHNLGQGTHGKPPSSFSSRLRVFA
jgi:hypothetical protein